jgi:type I restriction enzyme M protein
MLPVWQNRGVPTALIRDLLIPVEAQEEDILTLGQDNEEATYLVVGYDGFAKAGSTIDTSESATGGTLTRVRQGQIVVSHINAVNGSICVVPEEYDGYVITSEYSNFEASPGVDPWVLWTLLRSPEIRAEFLVRASGVGRTRVDWETIADVSAPLPDAEVATLIANELTEADRLLREVQERRNRARETAHRAYDLASEDAQATLRKFKPPK